MADSTNGTAPVKPARRCHLEEWLGARVLVIAETLGTTETVSNYHLAELSTDFGRGFTLTKFKGDGGDGMPYHVNLGGGAGNTDTCSCPWGTYRSNDKPCRHVAALKALLASGKLAPTEGNDR